MSVATKTTETIGRNFWGPRLWKIFHSFSANILLTSENRLTWRQFLRASLAAMNCSVCQSHFSVALRDLPILAIKKEELELWFFEKHNSVNFLTKKPGFLQEDLSSYKLTEKLKVELDELINQLSEQFLMNEHRLLTPAGTSKIWKMMAIRFSAQL